MGQRTLAIDKYRAILFKDKGLGGYYIDLIDRLAPRLASLFYSIKIIKKVVTSFPRNSSI